MAGQMAIDAMKQGRGPQVLVVEEQMMPVLLAEDVLLAAGYRVATASSFHGATRAMTTCVVDAVVLDLHLGDGSSLLLADEFLELGVPVLFVSTRVDARLPNRFGHPLILHKPYLPTQLVAGVSSLLKQGVDKYVHTPDRHTGCRPATGQCDSRQLATG